MTDEHNDAAVKDDAAVVVHLRAEGYGEAGDAVRDVELLAGDFHVDGDSGHTGAGGQGVDPQLSAVADEAEGRNACCKPEHEAVHQQHLQDAGQIVGAQQGGHGGKDASAVLAEGGTHQEEDSDGGGLHDHADEGEDHAAQGVRARDELFTVLVVLHQHDGDAQHHCDDDGLQDVALREGDEHIGGEHIREELRDGDVSRAGDLLTSEAGEVGVDAGLEDGSGGEADDGSHQRGEDIIDHDADGDATQRLQVLLGGDAGDDGHEYHGHDDHLDAVEPDGADELELDHDAAEKQTEDSAKDHGGEDLRAQADFFTYDIHTFLLFCCLMFTTRCQAPAGWLRPPRRPSG